MPMTDDIRKLLGLSEAAKSTASKEYEDAYDYADGLLKSVAAKLAKHAAAQKKKPLDYGFVGDIQHVADKLDDIDQFLKKY